MRRLAPLLCSLVTLLGVSTAPAAQGRSVLLLISDNQGQPDAGCYGNPVVHTPNLDRLAGEGIRFTDAFVTTASCSASRSVIYTGLHNHANGQYGHAHSYHNFYQRPNVRSVFQLLKAAGYTTGLIGKKHVKPEEKYPLDFEPKTGSRNVAAMAKAAGEFFESVGDDPFFLVIGFSDPHPTAREGQGYGVKHEYEGVETVRYDPANVIVPDYLSDRPETREEIAGYYQLISRLDAGVGMALDALAMSGKEDETLVIFLSDHGPSFPGAMANVYEPGLRIPFLVRSPKQTRRGVVNRAMVSTVDIVPTILDWTGAEGPGYQLHGRSLLPILEQANPEGWDEVYASHTFHEVTMYYPMRAIRTRRYKYIWNIAHGLKFPMPIDTWERRIWQGTLRRGDEKIGVRKVEKLLHRDEFELYDLQADPNEIHNLANDPAHDAIRKELAKKLKSFQERTNDPWVVRYRY
jgi:N-sulfoglucosamine sulfohydrolase